MRNTTLIAAIAAVLSQKFADERKTQPEPAKPVARPYCMGMDCCCGAGPCPADSASPASDTQGGDHD